MSTLNNLTLIIDGNWLLMSKVFSYTKNLAPDSPSKDRALKSLVESMIDATESIYRFLGCDNIILVSDGGSWRKDIELPEHHDEVYKANRSKTTDMDWDAIYDAFNQFKLRISSKGYTVSWAPGIEGDDWIWYWTNYLNSKGINGVIWSSDHDLRQLIRYDKSLICWYNNDLVLPASIEQPDILEAMINPIYNPLEHLQANKLYIDPADIVIGKILGGDSGDNIMSIIRYQKGDRTYKFSATDIKNLRKSILLESAEDPYKRRNEIANWIVSQDKFKPYKFKKSHIVDMIKLNTKLVWLHKSSYPKEILERMDGEYKLGSPYEQPEIDFSFLD